MRYRCASGLSSAGAHALRALSLYETDLAATAESLVTATGEPWSVLWIIRVVIGLTYQRVAATAREVHRFASMPPL
jgi:beta-lactamase regulating signal transducer with metallopeptidase domain